LHLLIVRVRTAHGVLWGLSGTYSTLGTMGEVPALAKRHGIRVTLGAWLDTDRARNEREIEQAIRLAKEHRNVVRIMVGNEGLLRGDLSCADLVAHLEYVRAATPTSATRSSSTA